jgi:hypothetical protein
LFWDNLFVVTEASFCARLAQSNDSGTFLTNFCADSIDPAERTLRRESAPRKGAYFCVKRPKSMLA